MASILERDHYVDNLLDRIDRLEERVEELSRSGLLVQGGTLVVGEGNVRVDTEGIALVDDGHASITKLKWKDESFQGETLGDILSDWTQVPAEDVVTWIRAFEHSDQTTGEAQIILKVDNAAQTDDTRLILKSATHEIEFGGCDLFEIRDDAGDTLYFSADDTDGIYADGVQMKDDLITEGGMPGGKITVAAMSIANAAGTNIVFTTEEWDTGTFFDIGTPGQLTVAAAVAGRYAVGGYIESANALTASINYVQLYKQGAPFVQQRSLGTTSSVRRLTVYAETEFAAGERLEMVVYQNNGQAQNFKCEMSMHRIGD